MSMTDGQPRGEEIEALEARHLELFRATTVFEHAALRPIFLLNGGAIVAALTFAGNQGKELSGPYMALAIAAWVIGLICAAAGTWFGYRSQHHFLKAFRRSIDVRRAREGQQDDVAALPIDRLACKALRKQGEHDRLGRRYRAAWGGCIGTGILLFAAGAALSIVYLYSLSEVDAVPAQTALGVDRT